MVIDLRLLNMQSKTTANDYRSKVTKYAIKTTANDYRSKVTKYVINQSKYAF